MRSVISSHRTATLPAAALALAACADSVTGPGAGSGDVRVNLFARTAGVTASIVSSSAAAGAAQSIDVDRVAIVVGAVKLETAGVDGTVDWVLEESRVVELDLAGGPTAAATYDVFPGTYKEVEVSIDKLEPGNPAEDPLISLNPELSDASVVVEGTVTRDDASTASFTWSTDLDRDLEVVLDPFLTVPLPPGELVEPTIIAVVIRVNDWFDDGAGGLLDPTDEANRSAIESNVGDSVTAFPDPDEDGQDDG